MAQDPKEFRRLIIRLLDDMAELCHGARDNGVNLLALTYKSLREHKVDSDKLFFSQLTARVTLEVFDDPSASYFGDVGRPPSRPEDNDLLLKISYLVEEMEYV